jgi:hypothetical protein
MIYGKNPTSGQRLAGYSHLIYDEVTITGEETKPVEVILSGK